VEVVANVHQENGDRVIQCNIRDITQRKAIELVPQLPLAYENDRTFWKVSAMTKKKRSSTSKPNAKKRSLNAETPNTQPQRKLSTGDPSDQDVKCRLGQFNGAGEPSLQLMGTRGKNHNPKSLMDLSA